ncbi:MAG: alanine--glyoxylate aminotransferase family protein, partial [Chloroflexi bacterium]|nr:alanine--glyoxylate aminotransferase family protein [Chloroflexota bacterium]
MNLRVPGPTPLPPAVTQALARPMINHRGPEFAALLKRITEELRWAFQTKHDVVTLTASGTGGLEAAIANLFSSGDRVLSVSCGAFGERFAKIASVYGLEVDRLDVPWGQAAQPAQIAARLDGGNHLAVLVTHNETSTGITNPLAEIVRAGRAVRPDILVVVDAISSLGAIDLKTDEWDCDVVITGSQKAFMIPPGLAMLSLSPRAWEANSRSKLPRFYLDLLSAKKSAEKGETPATPAVSLYFALEAGLELMRQEGLAQIFDRHTRIGQRTRVGVKALGLDLFADPRYASNTVT